MSRFSLRSQRNEKTWPIQKKGSFPRVVGTRRDAAAQRLPSARARCGSKTVCIIDEGGIYFSAAHFVNWQPTWTSPDISPIILAAKVTKIG